MHLFAKRVLDHVRAGPLLELFQDRLGFLRHAVAAVAAVRSAVGARGVFGRPAHQQRHSPGLFLHRMKQSLPKVQLVQPQLLGRFR